MYRFEKFPIRRWVPLAVLCLAVADAAVASQCLPSERTSFPNCVNVDNTQEPYVEIDNARDFAIMGFVWYSSRDEDTFNLQPGAITQLMSGPYSEVVSVECCTAKEPYFRCAAADGQ